jgi:Spy/CpxP family protein refolding chaperone
MYENDILINTQSFEVMKKTIAVLTATLFGWFVMAQPPMQDKHRHFATGKENRGRIYKGDLLKRIELTEEQKAEWQKIQKEHRQAMKSLMENEQISVKEQRDKLFELSKAHKKQIDALLTPAQREQLQAAMNLQKAKVEAKRAQGFARMSTRLNLSKEQQEAIKQEQVKLRNTLEAIRADKDAERTERVQKIKQAMENHKKAVAGLLTEAQKKEMENLKADLPGPDGPRGLHKARRGRSIHQGLPTR